MTNDESRNINRFLVAQNQPATCARCSGMTEYECASQELANQAKRCHWIWFVFPQITGLGKSPKAKKFAIDTLDEALAYGSDPLLRSRYIHVARLVHDSLRNGTGPLQLMGSKIDVEKLASSLTLFRDTASLLDDHELVGVAEACLELLATHGVVECDETLRWTRGELHG